MRDDELQRALKRVDPPAGFADRVLQRAGETPAPPQTVKAGVNLEPLKWAIAATIVLATLGGGSVWYRAEERRKEQGEEAKRQVLASLSLAGSKLKSIEMKVNRGEEH